MSLMFGEGPETPGAWSAVARLDPVAKLVITGVLTFGLLLSLDTTTTAVILLFELVAIPFIGLRPRTVVTRGGFLVLVAASITLVNALFSKNTDGYLLFSLGPFTLSTGGLAAASVVGMRVLALSLPAVLVLAATDPVGLADGLQQRMRVPARYALSMLVGLRLLPLLFDQWRELSAARRARGLTARGPVSAVRSALSRVVGLLVEALRRAVRMAMAMQARGFDPYSPRTFARQSVIGRAEIAAVIISVAIVVFATVLAIGRGDWVFALAWPL